ncbi:deacetylvindoline O-acetyltransferase [Tanacetum coccineum]
MIKPSSPTPCRLKTYNLSVYDQLAPSAYMPFVALRNLPRSSIPSEEQQREFEEPVVTNLTSNNDMLLSDFLQRSNHEDLDQLFPNDLICYHPYLKGDSSITCPLSVQVNHFACGGVAVATSLNHKLGDARTILNFINHWARRNAALFHSRDMEAYDANNPHLIYYQNRNINLPEMMTSRSRAVAMTVESGQPILNPTRVEVLTWLIHKCATTANTKTNSGAFKPTGMLLPVDMRNILVEKLPGTTIGNLLFLIDVPTGNEREFEPHMTIGELRKRKTQLQSIRNLETAAGQIANMSTETVSEMSNALNNYYIYSSMCRFPS